MTLDEYQALAKRTQNRATGGLINYTLGLVGEAGEVAELVKKHTFHGVSMGGRLQEELGDVLWYLAALCEECGLSLDAVAEQNVAKLKARYPEGFEHGGGIR